jgi:hypothetical protein
MDARETQASLILILPTTGQCDHGITKKQGHMNAPIDGLSVEFHRGRALLDLSEVNQGNLKGDTDLGCSKTDALRLSHRIFKDS